MAWTTYRLHRKLVFATPHHGNIDSRYLDKDFTPTEIYFRARTNEEAMKKARRFWEQGQFGMGCIIVKEEPRSPFSADI